MGVPGISRSRPWAWPAGRHSATEPPQPSEEAREMDAAHPPAVSDGPAGEIESRQSPG
jgi:hypothetical protein